MIQFIRMQECTCQQCQPQGIKAAFTLIQTPWSNFQHNQHVFCCCNFLIKILISHVTTAIDFNSFIPSTETADLWFYETFLFIRNNHNTRAQLGLTKCKLIQETMKLHEKLQLSQAYSFEEDFYDKYRKTTLHSRRFLGKKTNGEWVHLQIFSPFSNGSSLL